jgi:hypothetical protein
MKKTVLFAGLALIFAACSSASKEEINRLDTEAPRGKSYFSKSDVYPYKGMPPMVKVPRDNRGLIFDVTGDSAYQSIAHNPSTTWQQADALYDGFVKNTAALQMLGYVVLAEKNLIADDSPLAVTRKKFYIERLAETKYSGYCVLYYALKSLPASEKNFADEMAKTISDYAAKDAGVTVMKNFDLSVIADLKQRQKTADQKENFSYAEKIASWPGEPTARR